MAHGLALWLPFSRETRLSKGLSSDTFTEIARLQARKHAEPKINIELTLLNAGRVSFACGCPNLVISAVNGQYRSQFGEMMIFLAPVIFSRCQVSEMLAFSSSLQFVNRVFLVMNVDKTTLEIYSFAVNRKSFPVPLCTRP